MGQRPESATRNTDATAAGSGGASGRADEQAPVARTNPTRAAESAA
ncbi:MAG: hypothetical protein FWE15_27450 [Actinomycetia bacterium]|nr:hypothetical protein [Actinomycetes bacterium]